MKDYDFCPKYLLHAHADDESVDAIFDAMDELELETDYCVWFLNRYSEKNYIRFISEDGLAIMNINSCCILHNYLCDQCHCSKAHDNNTIRTTVTVRIIIIII